MADDRMARFAELYRQGMELLADGKDREAMDRMFEAAKTAPEGWLAVATQLIKDGKHHLALDRLREVLRLAQDKRVRCATHNNLGLIWAHAGNNEAAQDAFNHAAAESTEYPDTYSNLAIVAQWKGDYKAAVRYANMALHRDPWHEQAQFIRAMSLLLDCDYKNGFEEYECRWRSKSNGLAKVASPMPEWDGYNGKRVFIYGEQGHGDTILMLRYAKLIHERGLWQCWIAHKGLKPLLQTIPEIDCVIEAGEPIPDFDCHVPAVTLPRLFETTIETIPPAPYIPKPQISPYFGEGWNIGIAWRGSKAQTNDTFRSTQLALWEPILNLPGFTFHSLQVDGAEEALLYPQIRTYEKPIDWLETARRVAGLDLVISVDTGLVHLCGGMGVPVWVPMHCRPYFVYPPKFGEKTPWYPSVKLYRQPKELEWKTVFQKIAQDLAAARIPTRI